LETLWRPRPQEAKSSRNSGGGAGNRTRPENAPESLEKQPLGECAPLTDSSPFATVRDHSIPLDATAMTAPSDSAIERAIVDAVTMGLGDVARTLAARLEERKKARLPANVVDFEGRRKR